MYRRGGVLTPSTGPQKREVDGVTVFPILILNTCRIAGEPPLPKSERTPQLLQERFTGGNTAYLSQLIILDPTLSAKFNYASDEVPLLAWAATVFGVVRYNYDR